MVMTTVNKCLSFHNGILNANMTLFKVINHNIITCQCLCHDNLKLNCHVFGSDIGCHEALVMNMFRDLNYSGTH